MPNYDFKTLSPIDFEILIRDLLQEELGLRLETFKSGRDQGIDFRYCCDEDKQLIIQCKHCSESLFAQLFNRLQREEVEKVHLLSPARYILAISIGLTPNQKKQIFDLFNPYIIKPEDIITSEDVNNLLGKHPQIEKRNFKLWLTSITIFEEIFQSKAKNISKDALQRIREHAKYYVQNDSFIDAMKILEEHSFCIIAGIPGIGKTMLAEMLLLHYVTSGDYELIKITENISEAYSFHDTNIGLKRVYYYDDFLGQTSLSEKLNKNEDQTLLDFMAAIKKSKTSKLILTTREYILNQANFTYEKLSRTDFKIMTCVIDLQNYTRLQRAQILFNHLFFSDIPQEYKNYLISNGEYLEIIDHKNYNPRIIELMTTLARIQKIDQKNYVGFFVENLDNPSEIWRHAFEQQLSYASRNLLTVITSMSDIVFLRDLKKAFDQFQKKQAQIFELSIGANDFNKALKELEGNFIAIEKERSSDQMLVRLHNPSIKDFLQDYLAESDDDLLIIIESSTFFDQLMWLWRFGQRDSELIKAKIIANSSQFADSLKTNIDSPICRLGDIEINGLMYKKNIYISFEARVEFLVTIVTANELPEVELLLNETLQVVKQRIDQGKADRQDLTTLFKGLEALNYNSFIDESVLKKVKKFLISDFERIDDVEAFCNFAEMYTNQVEEDDIHLVVKELEMYVDGFEPADADTARYYAEILSTASMKLNVDLEYLIDKMEKCAEELEEELPSEPDYDDDWERFVDDDASDQDIHSLFQMLQN